MLLIVYLLTGTITGFVVNLVIYRNTITRCLLNVEREQGRSVRHRARVGWHLAGVVRRRVDCRERRRELRQPDRDSGLRHLHLVLGRRDHPRNHVLNNAGDTRAALVTSDFAADRAAAGVDQPAFTHRKQTYNRYRKDVAAGNFTLNAVDTEEIEFQRGPRAGILLPICLSANAFAGGARKAQASLAGQGLTASLRPDATRHASTATTSFSPSARRCLSARRGRCRSPTTSLSVTTPYRAKSTRAPAA
ncbi:MAG: hypothetical protein HND48_21915 [Chloroflexi bacterium]|nr:hypothetical protein [Chloroflexota bacterium]